MLGDKIVELRKLNNMTQSDLGNALNISPQAVSKWERNISQPDFDTIKKMSKIFNVSITEFSEDEDLKSETIINDNEEDINTDKLVLKCSYCGRKLESDEDIFSKEPEVICASCHTESEKEKNEIESLNSKQKKAIKQTSGKEFKLSFLWAALISVAVGGFLMIGIGESDVSVGEYIATVFAIALFTFTFSNQMFYDGPARDLVEWFTYRGFGLPGLIFSLDFGGILLFLLWKVIAPIFTLFISIIIFLFGVFLTFIISPFTFIYVIITRLVKVQNVEEEV